MKIFLFLLFFFFSSLFATNIQLIKKENSDSNTTLLVIGGIHGNEPGGYFAPAILATHYKILSKNLWIVPNLNKDSIIANKRGINGDMNRKFSYIKKNDKDKKIVEEIKKIILDKKVSLVLNLHDGHGFYRKDYQGTVFNPNAWGQTCVIDQCKLNKNQPFGNLDKIALTVKEKINKKLLKQHHIFNVKNTKTKYDDEAMQLSLTYFAVTNNKPAFAIETSKYLSSLSQKVFYQLLAIEEFMNIVGIKYKRDFKLNIKNISKLVKQYGNVVINGNIVLDLTNIKSSLSYIPLKCRDNIFKFTNPLGVVKKSGKNFSIYVGNKKITTLKPQCFKQSKYCLKQIQVIVDGKKMSVKATSDIYVNKNFIIKKYKGIRVNVIGYPSKKDESGVKITKKLLDKRFSVDRNGKVYRVEFYKNDKFCSMLMVHFR